MNGSFEIPTIVFLLVAVLLIARLVSVLGRKTGNERPLKTYRQGAEEPAAGGRSDNVIPLPRTGSDARPDAAEPDAPAAEERIKGAAPVGSPLEGELLAIARKDAAFDPKAFLSGAKTAYEMIVIAYAQGDRKQLKTLTAREVFDGFARAIGEREGKGEVNETNFIGIHKADLIDAELKDSIAKVTVKFVSQLITVVRNKAGTIVEGDANLVREVTDIWTFAREVASRDPNWKLVATQSAN
jgi:predicted lipid-binding transport protein (Tim44 family)